MTQQTRGLYNKFQVTRTDGQQDPDAVYFVLNVGSDRIARSALFVYAEQVAEKNPALSAEIFGMLLDINQHADVKPLDQYLNMGENALKGPNHE